MNVALLTSMSGIGGTENATVRIAKLLLDSKHKVFVLSSNGPFIDELIEYGVEYIYFDFYSNSLFDFMRTLVRLRNFIKVNNVDVLHCQMARPVIPAVIASVLSFNKSKVVWHSRGLESKTYPKVCKLFSFFNVFSIANCSHEKQKLIRYGYSPDKVAFSYNPLPRIPVFSCKSVSDKVRLGTLSRLSKDRNVSEALYILRDVINLGINAKLYVGGDGAELSALKRLARDLGIYSDVVFLGRVSNLDSFFSNVDIFINTLCLSGDDGAGIGNNILEAAVFSTPVVAYDSCGIKEIIINDETGFCVPIKNRAKFVKSIERLSKHKSLRDDMGERLLNHAYELCNDQEILSKLKNAYS